jgi:mono/diheme cytochrome c family protein
MGTPAATVTVYEPHLSLDGRRVAIEYVGYPAVDVMARLFGEDWHLQATTVELRALDGYVARIDVSRFIEDTAVLAFARKDGAPFTIDNPRQNQTDVPLAPWYLVWDNISNPALLEEGASNWPYQVHEVNLVSLSDRALLPDGLPVELHEGAELARTYCLQCHAVNGFGGEKHPANLAEIAKAYPEPDFTRWVLEPSSVRAGTSMPPLYRHIPDDERQRIAKTLFDYLRAVPVLR